MKLLLSETIDQLIELENKFTLLDKMPSSEKGSEELYNDVLYKLQDKLNEIKSLSEDQTLRIKLFIDSKRG